MTYDHRLRPAQPETPAADAFAVHRAPVTDTGLEIAHVREGHGYPLLLVHGYPETKRIWWRNIAALAAAGHEVVVPDLRGYGDSDLAADDVYDIAVYSRDIHTLMTRVLGHERFGVVAGDVGGVREAVRDGVNGLLVDSTQIDAIAGALDRLLGDDELRKTLGELGRRRVFEGGFRWEDVARRYEKSMLAAMDEEKEAAASM